jgi:hypothetical protein
MMRIAEVLAVFTASGSGLGITIAVLEGRSKGEVDLWGARGTAAGFLVGLFLGICCPEEL